MPPRDELNPIKIARYYHDIASAVAASTVSYGPRGAFYLADVAAVRIRGLVLR